MLYLTLEHGKVKNIHNLQQILPFIFAMISQTSSPNSYTVQLTIAGKIRTLNFEALEILNDMTQKNFIDAISVYKDGKEIKDEIEVLILPDIIVNAIVNKRV